jgi:hypothetical protein
MNWMDASLVGAAGGASIEAVDIIKSIRWHRQMPWNVHPDTIDPPRRHDRRPDDDGLPAPGRAAYLAAGLFRLFVSGALAGVIAASYPASADPLVSFLVGLGALSAVQTAASLVPLMVKSVSQAALAGLTRDASPARGDLERPPDASVTVERAAGGGS